AATANGTDRARGPPSPAKSLPEPPQKNPGSGPRHPRENNPAGRYKRKSAANKFGKAGPAPGEPEGLSIHLSPSTSAPHSTGWGQTGLRLTLGWTRASGRPDHAVFPFVKQAFFPDSPE